MAPYRSSDVLHGPLRRKPSPVENESGHPTFRMKDRVLHKRKILASFAVVKPLLPGGAGRLALSRNTGSRK